MNNLAYLKGVLDGDAWIDRSKQNRKPRLSLRVKSESFADAFEASLKAIGLSPHRCIVTSTRCFNGYPWTGHYTQVRATSPEELLHQIQSVDPMNDTARISYLRGFFQSEGHFHMIKYTNRECWCWEIYNKDLDKLERVRTILLTFGIKSKIYSYANRVGRLSVQKKKDILHLQSLGLTKETLHTQKKGEKQ